MFSDTYFNVLFKFKTSNARPATILSQINNVAAQECLLSKENLVREGEAMAITQLNEIMINFNSLGE